MIFFTLHEVALKQRCTMQDDKLSYNYTNETRTSLWRRGRQALHELNSKIYSSERQATAKRFEFSLAIPICHKRSVIFSLFDRIFLLSHLKFHYKNIIYMILLRNGYHLPFILSTIQMRIKFHSYKIKSTKIQTKNSNKYLTESFVRTNL